MDSTGSILNRASLPCALESRTERHSLIVFSRQAPGTGAKAQAGANNEGAAISQVVANQVVGRIVAGFGNGLTGITIRIVDTFNDLPQLIIDATVREQAENAIDGVNSNNSIYLVRGRYATAEQFRKITLYELYDHERLHRLFG
jgi:hypothetical protein